MNLKLSPIFVALALYTPTLANADADVDNLPHIIATDTCVAYATCYTLKVTTEQEIVSYSSFNQTGARLHYARDKAYWSDIVSPIEQTPAYTFKNEEIAFRG